MSQFEFARFFTMTIKSLSRLALVLVAIALAPASQAAASLLVPDSITGQGNYNRSESLLIDGVFSSEAANWQNSTTVWWTGQSGPNGVVFTLDYGSLKNIDDVYISVDNNDGYVVEYSTDNTTYSNLFTIQSGYGDIGGGMDTMRTVAGDSEYVAGIDFSSVQAQYLRVYAFGGDSLYSISEIQAYGSDVNFNAVPEPATIAIWSVLGAVGLAFASRARKRAQ